MRVYTIIGGVDGVGKSSFTGVLKERCADLGIIVDIDRIIAGLDGDTVPGAFTAVMKIIECTENGMSFTYETTLSGRKTEDTARDVKKGAIMSDCSTLVWTPPQRASRASRTVSGVAAMISRRMTWNAALLAVGKLWKGSFLTVMKQSSMTMTTVL